MIGECFVATAHGPIAVADLQPGELLFTWDQTYHLSPLEYTHRLDNIDLYRAIFDNGISVHGNRSQEIMLRGATYRKMDSIDQFASVMPFTRTNRGKEWSLTMYDEDNTRIPEHLFISAHYGIAGEHIHHINGNHMDNRPENLIGMTEEEHREVHRQCHAAKRKKVENDLKDSALSVRAESWRQWYSTLTQAERDIYWSKLREGTTRSLRQRMADGVHNFIANNPMNDPEKVLLMKKAKIAVTAYKLKDMGLPILEESWDESVTHSGLYKSHRFRSAFVIETFGDWPNFLAFLDSYNAKMILMEFDNIGIAYEVGIENFVVCDSKMTKGVVVKGF